MEEQTEKKRPGRPKAEKQDAVETKELALDDITRDDIQRIEDALGCASSFWGGIDPRRIVLAVIKAHR